RTWPTSSTCNSRMPTPPPSTALSACVGAEVVDVPVVVVELFVVPAGDGAALVVDAWTSVIEELSFVLADEPAGGMAGFVWESALETAWRVPVAADFGAAVEELVCPSERVMAPSNTAVPQIRCLK